MDHSCPIVGFAVDRVACDRRCVFTVCQMRKLPGNQLAEKRLSRPAEKRLSRKEAIQALAAARRDFSLGVFPVPNAFISTFPNAFISTL